MAVYIPSFQVRRGRPRDLYYIIKLMSILATPTKDLKNERDNSNYYVECDVSSVALRGEYKG
jgi:hypothetical protein